MAAIFEVIDKKVSAEDTLQKFQKLQKDLQTIIGQIDTHLVMSRMNVGFLGQYTAASSLQGDPALQQINQAGKTGHDELNLARTALSKAMEIMFSVSLSHQKLSDLLADPTDLLHELKNASSHIRLSLHSGKIGLMLLEEKIKEHEKNPPALNLGQQLCASAKANMGSGENPTEKLLLEMIDSLLVDNRKKLETAHEELLCTASLALRASGSWETLYAQYGESWPEFFQEFSNNIECGISQLNQAYIDASKALGKKETDSKFSEFVGKAHLLAKQSHEASVGMLTTAENFAKTYEGPGKSALQRVLFEVQQALSLGSKPIKLLKEILNSLQADKGARKEQAPAPSAVALSASLTAAPAVLPSGGPVPAKSTASSTASSSSVPLPKGASSSCSL